MFDAYVSNNGIARIRCRDDDLKWLFEKCMHEHGHDLGPSTKETD